MARPLGSPGIIYVLINEAMPGYVKVGKTEDLDRRLQDLDDQPASSLRVLLCSEGGERYFRGVSAAQRIWRSTGAR